MIIAHLGIGLLILGITGSSIWQEEKITKMKISSETKIEKYNIVFEKINEIRGSNYVALQGNFLIYDEEKNIIAKLKPENRFYPITNNFTTEASIHTNLFRDLYIVLGEGNLNDGWVVRIYYNPLVIWIWIGALVIFLGGIISININLKKLKPENRFYPVTNNFTTEASIHTNLFRDLYIVLGEGNLNDGWVVRIYYNPLVIWIWIGALVIFLGGITSININLKKLKILSQ